MYNDFTDTVSAGPKGGLLKETNCQESSKPLGQVEGDYEDGSSAEKEEDYEI